MYVSYFEVMCYMYCDVVEGWFVVVDVCIEYFVFDKSCVIVVCCSVVIDELCGFYCLMGICFECLVIIDGVQNCQVCMVFVCEGMVIFLQCGVWMMDGGG